MTDSLRYKAAIVGAAETTELGAVPNMSTTQLHVDAIVNAIKDCGIDKNQIDGIATTMNPAMAIAIPKKIKIGRYSRSRSSKGLPPPSRARRLGADLAPHRPSSYASLLRGVSPAGYTPTARHVKAHKIL